MYLKTAGLSCFLVLLASCGYGERVIQVENCGEPIQVSNCRWKGQLFNCDIENTGNTAYKGTSVWRFDHDGAALEAAPYRYAIGLQPGKQVTVQLPVTKYNQDTTARVIFCSTRPPEAAKKAQSADN